jgi:hypothetical protein
VWWEANVNTQLHSAGTHAHTAYTHIHTHTHTHTHAHTHTQDVAELLGVHEVPLEWALTSSVLPSATKTQSIRRRVMDRAGSMFLRWAPYLKDRQASVVA